jgi:hypothetical protein
VKDGRVVGVVDRVSILRAMSEDPDSSSGSRGPNGSS